MSLTQAASVFASIHEDALNGFLTDVGLQPGAITLPLMTRLADRSGERQPHSAPRAQGRAEARVLEA